ncbi:MAG: hypothetical protein IJ743_00095 [Bacilli bacterium]|nr:hypothetical protein [Bacilli bacterium]
MTINPLKSNTLTKDKIKYAIYKSTETKPTSGINLGTVTDVNTDLSSFSNASAIDESLIVSEGYLKGATTNGGNDGESVTYILYLWMDENDTLADKNKTFEASVYVSNVAKKVPPTAAETILGLVPDADPTDTSEIDNGTDESGCTNTLAYDDFGNLRYTGANPCNFVTFNEEDAGWRIIGVFDNQIKLIRKESIGLFPWDASDVNKGYGINQWGESGDYKGADLMKLLNPGYENNMENVYHIDVLHNTIYDGLQLVNNSLYWNRKNGTYYNTYRRKSSTCNFSSSGLTDTTKEMIDNHIWNLGSNDGTIYVFNNIKVKPLYELERSNNFGKICNGGEGCNDTVDRTLTWEGYVGLMYPSDYGYAVGGEVRDNCIVNTNLYNYNTNNCNMNDWILYSDNQWTITPFAHSSSAMNVFFVDSNGTVQGTSAVNEYAVRPTVFLKSNVVMSGSGTPTNPYVLSLE